MKALITGACGFVGTYLVKVLLSNNIEVFGVDKTVKDKVNKVEYYELDILDKEALTKTLYDIKPDYIFHLAGIASVKFSWENPELTHKINAEGTRCLLDAIPKNSDPRIFFASTAEIYGIPKEVPLKETHEVNPQNPYAKSKLEAEKIIQNSKYVYIISRSFQHIGPGQSLGFVCPDFAKQIAEIEKGEKEPIMYVGNLNAKRDFTDVRDIVNAYFLAMTKGIPGEIYNICSGNAYLIQDILQKLLDMSKVKIKVKEDPKRMRPVKIPVQVGDNSEFVKQTGWKPKISIEQSLKDVLGSWRNRV